MDNSQSKNKDNNKKQRKLIRTSELETSEINEKLILNEDVTTKNINLSDNAQTANYHITQMTHSMNNSIKEWDQAQIQKQLNKNDVSKFINDKYNLPNVSTIQKTSNELLYLGLTSPNNPFLPDIIAKTYGQTSISNDINKDSTINLLSSSSSSSSSSLPLTENTIIKNKLSIDNPKQESNNDSCVNNYKKIISSDNQRLSTKKRITKKLNPFSSDAITENISVSSDNNFEKDLNAKREEFLKTTMKICLVVSPPSSKLQLKSKSLTHLDTLESLIAASGRSQGCVNDPKLENQQTQPKSLNNSIRSQFDLDQDLNYFSNISKTDTDAGLTLICDSTKSCPSFVSQHVHAQKKIKTAFIRKKKPILSRSQVSSSEYFSVHFYSENGCQQEELIPATQNVTLSTAIGPLLKKRNLSFSQVTISDNTFHGDNTNQPPFSSSFDENTDVERLAGKLLIVSKKESDNKKNGTLQKAASFGSRSRPPCLLSSASAEETSEIDQKIIPGKQLKQRWSGLFGIKNTQQTQLYEILNTFTKTGVPQKQSILDYNFPELQKALTYLENMKPSWKNFVAFKDLTENEIKTQSAIWELVTTEVDYIHALQTVTDLFLACLEAIQDKRLLTDIDQSKLFSNIREICEANLHFWTHYLYPMVSHSEETGNPMSINFFQPGFTAFSIIFSPYKKYCAEQSTCQFYCKELNRNNSLFTAYLAWCESQKMCNRLRLADILVRPMQRLTKYNLLLSAIKRNIINDNLIDIMDTMIHFVDEFVYSVNTHLTTRQENERLKGIMARIESYEVADSNSEQLDKLARQYSTMLDLCTPMHSCPKTQGRHLFMEGDLKYKDSLGKVDVHCFLLTDILLVCKTIAKKPHGTLKVVRQPFLTDKIIVKHKENTLYCVYLNDFHMAIAAFTLQCSEAKSWNDAITKAKHIYSRLKQGSGSSINTENFENKKSPVGSSVGSRVSSLNNSHSGSVELNDSRNISLDFEKANSLSSDEGCLLTTNQGTLNRQKNTTNTGRKQKISPSNQLVVQPLGILGQSLPNLSLNPSSISNLYHTYSNNTLLVPGTSNPHSGNLLLSPSHRGISYPPPSPTRATLRRGFAFSASIKNPPLVKTRNITSQNSINTNQAGIYTTGNISSNQPQKINKQFLSQKSQIITEHQCSKTTSDNVINESQV